MVPISFAAVSTRVANVWPAGHAPAASASLAVISLHVKRSEVPAGNPNAVRANSATLS